MKRLKAALLAPVFAALAAVPAVAQSVEDFYKGKTLTIAVGYTAGGGYDIYARLMSRYIGKYLPGNPTVIVENMPGAGSISLANQLANTLPSDGTVIGVVGRGIPVEPLLGVVDTKYDAQKLKWIGSMTDEMSVCVAWHTSGIESWDDITTGGKELVMGGNGAAADNEVYPRMLANLLGAHIRMISGYPGSSEIALAMEQGEIDGQCGSWSSISQYSDWVSSGKVKVLVQLGGEPLPGMNVPQVRSLAKDDSELQVLNMILSRLQTARPFLAPPAIPEDRLAALREAFMKAMADPDLIAEAQQMKIEINPISGEEVEKIINDIYATPQDVVDRTRAIVAVQK